MLRPWTSLWVGALILVVVVQFGAGWAIRNSVARTFDTSQSIRRARALLFATLRDQLDEETGIRGYLATRDRLFLAPYRAARRALPGRFAALNDLLAQLHLTHAQNALADAANVNSAWITSVAAPSLRKPETSTLTIQKAGKRFVDRFRNDWHVVDAELDRRNDLVLLESERELAEFGALIVVSALLSFAIGFFFADSTAQAWRRLERARGEREEMEMRERDLRAAFSAERRVVETLQRAFVQRALPAVPSVTFSSTYASAGEQERVGGDWYDAFDLGAGRVLFAIGDVAGHGMSAAVTMSRVRNEILAAALVEADASAILARVNQSLARDASQAPTVTALVGIAETHGCTFEYSGAGHPPPILAEPGVAPRCLEYGGLPLGISADAGYRLHRVTTVPGALLVLYTDGVTELSHDILAGERALLDAITKIPPRADPAKWIYRRIFEDASAGDDVAILTLSFSSAGAPPVVGALAEVRAS